MSLAVVDTIFVANQVPPSSNLVGNSIQVAATVIAAIAAIAAFWSVRENREATRAQLLMPFIKRFNEPALADEIDYLYYLRRSSEPKVYIATATAKLQNSLAHVLAGDIYSLRTLVKARLLTMRHVRHTIPPERDERFIFVLEPLKTYEAQVEFLKTLYPRQKATTPVE